LGDDDLPPHWETGQPLTDEQRAHLKQLKGEFIQHCGEVTAVLCCRVTPKQKGDIAQLVKSQLKKVTLGIGDGANDVAMIKGAHVGVGIAGIEGTQAVNNADFAITEFRHLGNLLLVHGRWTYRRIAQSVCYFFYKSVAFCFTLVWATFYSGFGGNYFYDEWLTTLWSPIFTCLPVVVFALFEQDLNYEASMKNPQVYKEGQVNQYFEPFVFCCWLANAFWDSIVVFFMSLGIMSALESGRPINHDMLGILMYGMMLIVVTVRLMIQTKYYPVLTWVIYTLSVAIYYFYLLGECALPAGLMMSGQEEGANEGMYWEIYNMLAQFAFCWLGMLVVITATLLPAYVWGTVQVLYLPSRSEKAAEDLHAQERLERKKRIKNMEQTLDETDEHKEARMKIYKEAVAQDTYEGGNYGAKYYRGEVKLEKNLQEKIASTLMAGKFLQASKSFLDRHSTDHLDDDGSDRSVGTPNSVDDAAMLPVNSPRATQSITQKAAFV